jgi:hypothetical protein
MKSFLATVRSWFKADPAIRNTRYSEGFEALDPTKVFDQFRLAEQAKDRANLLINFTTIPEQDEIEQTVAAHFKAYESEQLKIAQQRLELHQNVMDKAALIFDLQALRSKIDDRLAKASQEAIKYKGRLREKLSPFRDAKIELDDFRQENGLTRVLPKNQKLPELIKWAIVWAAIVFEAAVNLGFYQTAFRTGLIAAFGMAFIISLANVLIPLEISKRLIVERNSKSAASKAIGWISLVVLLIYIGLLNLFAAHIREAGVLSQSTDGVGIAGATQLALTTFVSQPFVLSDVGSVLLLIAGLFFGVMASVFGYNFDDPVPGFGAKWRQYRDAQRDMLELIDEAHDEVGICFSEITDEIESRLSRLSSSRGQIVQSQAKIENILSQYEKFQNQLRISYTAVIQKYRSELAKNGVPLANQSLPAYTVERFQPRIARGFVSSQQDADRLLAEAERALPMMRGEVRRKNEELIGGIETLEVLEELKHGSKT